MTGPVPPATVGPDGMVTITGILRGPRRAALGAIAGLVAGASLVSFAESYHALYLWAARHGAGGNWALSWPAMVDVFIAVGELSLFVAMIDRWDTRNRALAWTVTLTGLAVSVAGNVGHVTSSALASRVTAAVPPLAATAALAVGLGVLKRVAAATQDTGTSPEVAASAPETAPEAPAVADAPVLASTPVAGQPDTSRPDSRTVTDIEAEALSVLSRQPDISGAALGRAVGVSGRTGQRLLTRLTARETDSIEEAT